MDKKDERTSIIIDRIGKTIGHKLNVVIKPDNRINAEANHLQDNRIELTSGAVDKLDDDELAWLIAHEAEHLEKKHGKETEKQIDESGEKIKNAISKIDQRLKDDGAGFIKRILVGTVVLAAGVGSTILESKANSRKQEDEADSSATELAERAGFRGEAGVSALKKMGGGKLYQHSLVGHMISNHPDSASRAQKILEKNKK